MMKHFASGQGSQFPPGKTSGCPSAQGCCKTIRFASLENLGARIRHGGAGRSCPGLLDWPTHGPVPRAANTTVISRQVSGLETGIQWIERGATRETRKCLLVSALTWLEPLIISLVPSLTPVYPGPGSDVRSRWWWSAGNCSAPARPSRWWSMNSSRFRH